MSSTFKDELCYACSGTTFLAIPDSIAAGCIECGWVRIYGFPDNEPRATLQDWARDIYEAKRNK